jgi:DNA repair protein RecO (recombination protein O)
MEWTDEGIVLGVRRHGESAAIVELLTRAHGRHLGIVRGGRSRRQQPVLQPGNRISVVWRARIEEHLGTFAVEPLELRAGTIIQSGLALQGINLIGALLRLLPERDPHPALFEAVEIIAGHLHDPGIAPALMV